VKPHPTEKGLFEYTKGPRNITGNVQLYLSAAGNVPALDGGPLCWIRVWVKWGGGDAALALPAARAARWARRDALRSSQNPAAPALACASVRPSRRTSRTAFRGLPPAPDDPLLSFAPVPHKAPRSNSITAPLQRAFIAQLAAT